MEKLFWVEHLFSFTNIMRLRNNVLIKIISIICFVLIILAIIILMNSPVTGYELSIYMSLPFAWIFLIVSIAGGISIITSQAFAKKESNYWLLGFLILILSNFIVLSSSIFRGYYFYGKEDSLAHLGWIKDILSTAHVPYINAYPISHILTSQISLVSGIRPLIIMSYVPIFFSILFMVSIYLLAGVTLPKKGQVLLASASSGVLFFSYYHVTFYPAAISTLLLPLVFYLYFKSKLSIKFNILFIIFLILYPFFHPVTAVMLIFFLIAIELVEVAYFKKRPNVRPILILSISFLFWISSNYMLGWGISNLITTTHKGYVSEHFEVAEHAIQHITKFELIEVFLKGYGDNLIYLILSAIAIYIIIRYRKQYENNNLRNLFMLIAVFMVSGPLSLHIFLGSRAVAVGRLLGLNPVMLMCPILVGFALYELSDKKLMPKLKIPKILSIIFIIYLLTLTSTISVLGVYHSPWIMQHSWQRTQMDVKGEEWFSAHYSPTISTSPMGLHCPVGKFFAPDVPEHFNYSYHETLGMSFAQDRYIQLTKRCKLANANPVLAKARMNPHIGWGFNEEDFKKVEQDPSVAKLYSNGEFDTFLVNSSNDGAWK